MLTLSANPARVDVGEQSTLTITAQRENGQPVNPGTEIFLTTDLGLVPGVVETDQRGRAEAILEAGNRAGTATVVAVSGSATVEATVEIVDEALAALHLTAEPTSLPSTGGTVTLRALARNDDGQAMPGVPVTFSTEVGALDSAGGIVVTGSDGVARDRLRVSAATAEARAGTTFQVRASAIEDGTSVNADVTLRIEEPDGT